MSNEQRGGWCAHWREENAQLKEELMLANKLAGHLGARIAELEAHEREAELEILELQEELQIFKEFCDDNDMQYPDGISTDKE